MQTHSVASQRQHSERRRFSRVKVDCCSWLIKQDKRYRFGRMFNLSLGGVCLQGSTSLQPGDICSFEVHDNGSDFCRIVKVCARVIRTDSEKLALEFVTMDADDYMFLQTLILYNTDDPLGVVTEFQDNFPSPAVAATC